MFDLELQRRIREKKTPLALTLAPEAEKLNGKFVKNFIDMFGDTPMAQAEALRYHGTTLLDAAAGKLPASCSSNLYDALGLLIFAHENTPPDWGRSLPSAERVSRSLHKIFNHASASGQIRIAPNGTVLPAEEQP